MDDYSILFEQLAAATSEGLAPATGDISRIELDEIAELRASLGLAEKRLARLQELSDTVPRREIEAAQSELASHRERISSSMVASTFTR